jgi:hypothetical protein
VRKGRNGRESLIRLKPTVGRNANKRRKIYFPVSVSAKLAPPISEKMYFVR